MYSARAPRLLAALLGVVAAIAAVAFAPRPALAQAPSSGSDIPQDATVESLFVDFMHYARLGRFSVANAYAEALLNHPDLDPAVIHDLAQRDKKSLDTLFILMRHSDLGDEAQRVMDLIQRGEQLKRQDPEQIRVNIDRLAGDPQQEYFAIQRLHESGEYAIPAMVQTLIDPSKRSLWPRVVNALGRMGKPAVRPMVEALNVDDDAVRVYLIDALGEIGYPQAIPYLSKVAQDPDMPDQSRQAARAAIDRIQQKSGRALEGPPEVLFYGLAEAYYDENDAVRADPRLATANVWYWDEAGQFLRAVVVPEPIFGSVMAMRTTGEALLLREDFAESIALWLAANIRREARLGLDVESGDPDAPGREADETRPENFPRALYFTQAAGPRYAHMVLDRAVGDGDSQVALGAIRALKITAGESSLVGSQDYKQPLVVALRFPDLLVRIRAALALGGALPKSSFADSEFVVPLLGTAVTLTGAEHVVVVDPDQSTLNRTLDVLRRGDREAIGGESFYRTVQQARESFPTISGIVVSADVQEPDLGTALSQLRSEFLYQKTPVVIVATSGNAALAEDLAERDPFTEVVLASAGGAGIEAALERAGQQAGLARIDGDLALSLALEAVETLRTMALDGRTVYDVSRAEPALIAALGADDPTLRTSAADALALIGSSGAQQAIAAAALSDRNTTDLRVSVFGSLAESAKRFGNMLQSSQVDQLVALAKDEPDLTLRTAASEALGAVNLATSQASAIIRGYHEE